MAVSSLDFKNQYAMFGALSSGGNGMHAPKSDEKPIDFGQKSIEGIGGQSGAEKTAGIGQFSGANLGFVQRLDKIDEMNKLDRPEAKSAVEGFSTGLADRLDLMA
ncbi:hypothetical protein IJ425_08780 [bacterium]|nr:hypothetical protein [bacterium]